MTAPIDRLAELAGIEPIYFDAWGNRNVVSAESKRRLLAGMGFDVSSDEAVGRVAAEVEAKPWGRLAPPVVVATQGEVAVPLTVGAEAALDPVVWTVTLEDGGTRRGEADLAALAAEGEHRLPEGLRRRLRLPLPGDLPTGYHRLALELGGQRAELSLIVAPGTCFGTGDVPGLPNGRAWGLTCQLYSLRDGQDWGIGDFASLAAAAERAGALGANLLGVNPLHTLFYVAPEAKSPYFPSTRNFLNYLYIALPSVPEFAEAAETRAMMADDAFRSRLEAARAAAHVDYTAVAALKKPALEACYAAFRKANLGRKKTERGAAFRAFQAEMGAALRGLALYEALQEHLFGRDMQQFGWPQWPEAYRDPSSETVRKFEQDNLARVEYFEYLQFLADEQLAAACARGAKAGLKVGIYRDIAVGVDPYGAEGWAGAETMGRDTGVGCPPDLFNSLGQAWGLAPISPVGMVETAYAPFIRAIRSNMRHSGALRIDHIIGLMRMFWIPSGEPPGKGAYVRYPLDDMFRIIALESHRHGCVVIGEDLGTVPEGFGEIMQRYGLLSYKVLYFQRGEGEDPGFVMPEDYPREALVTVSTHDLPSLAGLWCGRDLEWRTRLKLYADEEKQREHVVYRQDEKRRLVHALIHAGLLPEHERGLAEGTMVTRELLVAVHRYIARTPCRVVLVQIEDGLGLAEQMNMPGTVDEHPNWRTKLPVTVDEAFQAEGVVAVAEAVRREMGQA